MPEVSRRTKRDQPGPPHRAATCHRTGVDDAFAASPARSVSSGGPVRGRRRFRRPGPAAWIVRLRPDRTLLRAAQSFGVTLSRAWT